MQLAMPEKDSRTTRLPLYLALCALLLAGLGAYLWYNAGRLRFEAKLAPSSQPILAERQGRIVALEVEAGQHVRRGQVLMRFDDAGLHSRVDQDRQALAALALALPPEHLLLPDGKGGTESLSAREEHRRQTEEEARSAVQAATDREAQAAVLYNRAALLAAAGKLPPEDRDAAEIALNSARQAAAEERRRFEALSLARAQSSADIRRLKEAQLLSGAAALPVETRLTAFEQARDKLARNEAALANSMVTAPEDGQLSVVFARPGDKVDALQPVAELLLDKAPLLLEGVAPLAAADRLERGQPCLVDFQDEKESRKGLVHSFAPALNTTGAMGDGRPQPERHLSVRVLLTSDQAVPATGGQARVTVLLREEPSWPESSATKAPKPVDPQESQAAGAMPVTASPGQAAPPASPLSVQTPFGGDVETPLAPDQSVRPARTAPPTVKAGSPEATGMTNASASKAPAVAPPALPPMKAPHPLRGSPLPDPANNPSVARPQDLERHETRP